jgi:hypothetical protein
MFSQAVYLFECYFFVIAKILIQNGIFTCIFLSRQYCFLWQWKCTEKPLKVLLLLLDNLLNTIEGMNQVIYYHNYLYFFNNMIKLWIGLRCPFLHVLRLRLQIDLIPEWLSKHQLKSTAASWCTVLFLYTAHIFGFDSHFLDNLLPAYNCMRYVISWIIFMSFSKKLQ